MPAYKPPSKFPGLDKLPKPIKSLAEFVFPQEPDMPIPMATAVGGPAEKIARKVLSTVKIPGQPRELHPAVRVMLDMLEQPPPPVDPNAIALGERVVGKIIPRAPRFQPPPGMHAPAGTSQGFTPHNIQNASLAQEGFPGQFGRSPMNQWIDAQQTPSLKKLGLRKQQASPAQGWGGRQINQELRQGKKAPAIRGIEELELHSSGPQSKLPAGEKPKPYGKLSGQFGSGPKAGARARSKLDEQKVRDIRKKFDSGMTATDIRNQFYPDMAANTIDSVARRMSWVWVK